MGSRLLEEAMKIRGRGSRCLVILLTAGLSITCEKQYHQPNERYVLVTTNATLPYWLEAKAGFMDAARALGVKASMVGPDSYSPDEELEAFQ
jgi:ribose transport system substrate-binding protein